MLDHPETVAGKRVLDLASGSGLVALAAARCGAASVLANEVDPYADAAIMLNAAANGATVRRHLGDLLDAPVGPLGVDVVLAGDVFYSREMARRMLAFFTAAHDSGAAVLVRRPRTGLRPARRVRSSSPRTTSRPSRDLESADEARAAYGRRSGRRMAP